MATDNLNLGKLITGDAQRDAVHIAVSPVVAGHFLQPGALVELGEAGEARLGTSVVGIVDPFLTKPVQKGERFWLFLLPGSITSLRHDWTHPAFIKLDARPSDLAFSKKWLEIYAIRMSPYDDAETAYDDLIAGLKSGELHANGTDLACLSDLNNADELREHAERVLGISLKGWGEFTFSCGC